MLAQNCIALGDQEASYRVAEKVFFDGRRPPLVTVDKALIAALKRPRCVRAPDLLRGVDFVGVAEGADTVARGEWIAEAGEPGVRDLLARLQANAFAKNGGDWGLRSLFGRLYKWLWEQLGDPAYLPVQEIFRQYVIETFPFGPGDLILGREVAARRLHSVRSASKEVGAHRKRLRKLLHAAGHISAEQLALTDDRILFNADAAQDLLSLISEEMPLQQVGQYLNIPRHIDRQLFTAGFIRPFIVGGLEKSIMHAFAKRDLDAFFERLKASATEIGEADKGYLPITTAALHASANAVQVVELILGHKLKRVRTRSDVSGFQSIMVDPDEIRSVLFEPRDEILSLKQVEKRLTINYYVVQRLIEHGHLPAHVEVNAKSRLRQRVVSEDDIAHFTGRFVSLHTLAKETSVHFRKLADMLKERGIEPVFDPKIIKARFYERSAVNETLAQ